VCKSGPWRATARPRKPLSRDTITLFLIGTSCHLSSAGGQGTETYNVYVDNNRLFKIKVSDQECTAIQYVNDLIQLYLTLSKALTMSR